MSYPRSPDIEAIVSLLSTAEGGRSMPARSGYRPQHRLPTDYQTSGMHQYIDTDELAPGESARATIVFVTPEAYPNSIRAGDVLDVMEGGRILGHATVLRVLNASLERQL